MKFAPITIFKYLAKDFLTTTMPAKVISFATQKGGSGKTTMLMLTAAAIHNRTNKKLLVIDADPQLSVKDYYKFENSDKSYDVFAFNWYQPKPEVNFEKVLTLAKSKYDIILIDVPGKLRGDEVFYSILHSDIVMVPIVASALDIKATVDFLMTIPEMVQEASKKPQIYGVINKKDHTVEQQQLLELNGVGGMELFYSPLSSLVRYRRSISTVNDITDPTNPEDEFNSYFDEFRNKCFI